jgi:heme O synthase-like polyprenyltransferase
MGHQCEIAILKFGQRAGYPVLPVTDKRCAFVNWMTVLPLLVFIPLALFPALFGDADVIYALGPLFAGSLFFITGLSSLCKTRINTQGDCYLHPSHISLSCSLY